MINAWLIALAQFVAGTGLTNVLAERLWIVPALQVIHILSVAVVISGVAIINLRVLGLVERAQPLGVLLDRFLRPIAIAICVLALTGLLLISAEPNRAPFRTIFWIKMALIVVASLLTWTHRRGQIVLAGPSGERTIARKAVAVAAMLAWIAVVVAGRWIAYSEAWAGAPE
jgi:hypothetical protein